MCHLVATHSGMDLYNYNQLMVDTRNIRMHTMYSFHPQAPRKGGGGGGGGEKGGPARAPCHF